MLFFKSTGVRIERFGIMYCIYVTFKCFPGKREEYVKLLNEKGYLEEIRKEDGCICYDYYFSEKDENELLLIEMWESKAHQQAHIETPHMKVVLPLGKKYIMDKKLGEFNLL